MSTYLQMGHESWSLLEEPDGGRYAGIVLSPVNDGPDYVIDRLGRLGDQRANIEVILDPQLYNPAAQRGQLNEWPYYSAEFETENHHDEAWWITRGSEIAQIAARIGADAMCTPAMFPRDFSDDYYRFVVDIANETQRCAKSVGVETLLTAIVSLRGLGEPKRALEIASILTETDCERVYLTFLAEDVQQREPLKDAAGLATAVHLIRLLSASQRVHVAFCAHDLILWKAAGAADASTGKWMNVRRFSPGRWREEEEMGRQLPYWNEASLLTLLRDQDVLRLDREGWFDGMTFADNPAASRILEILRAGTGVAWQKLCWLQYLQWFSNVEGRFADLDYVLRELERVDKKWSAVDARRVRMSDRFNDGAHVRAWLNALDEGSRR